MIAGFRFRACRAGGRILFLAVLGMAAILAPVTQASAATSPAPTRVGPGVYIAEAAEVEGHGESAEIRSRRSAPRIVGGTPTTIGQVPWQVAVTASPAKYEGSAFDRQFCGGSLVAPTLVITAAHCMFGPDGAALPPDDFAVVSGRTRLSSSEGQEILVAEYFLFVDDQGRPLYDGVTSGWDVALLQLAEPSASPTIKIVGLDERELWANGRAAYVSGWGAIRFQGPGSDDLLVAELAVLPESHCIRSLPDVFRPDTSFCVGVTGGERDSCHGDSGGPLVVPTAGGEARLAGDVQAGFECGRLGNPGFYGRFGADPLHNSLRNAAQQIVGIDIAGSGAQPPLTLTRNQAVELAWVHSENKCNQSTKCRRYGIGRCRPKEAGFRCPIRSLLRSKRLGRYTCVRKVLWTADTGTIQRRNLGEEKCSTGW